MARPKLDAGALSDPVLFTSLKQAPLHAVLNPTGQSPKMDLIAFGRVGIVCKLNSYVAVKSVRDGEEERFANKCSFYELLDQCREEYPQLVQSFF